MPLAPFAISRQLCASFALPPFSLFAEPPLLFIFFAGHYITPMIFRHCRLRRAADTALILIDYAILLIFSLRFFDTPQY